MCQLNPGDLVLCIDDVFPSDAQRFYAQFGLAYPVAGRAYTVRSLDPDSDNRALCLNEIVNPAIELVRGSDRRRFERKEPPFAARRFIKLCDTPDAVIGTEAARASEKS